MEAAFNRWAESGGTGLSRDQDLGVVSYPNSCEALDGPFLFNSHGLSTRGGRAPAKPGPWSCSDGPRGRPQTCWALLPAKFGTRPVGLHVRKHCGSVRVPGACCKTWYPGDGVTGPESN